MEVPARALQQPVVNQLGLMGGRVIEHQMHVEIGRHAGLDLTLPPVCLRS
jgi:hypothetical protein